MSAVIGKPLLSSTVGRASDNSFWKFKCFADTGFFVRRVRACVRQIVSRPNRRDQLSAAGHVSRTWVVGVRPFWIVHRPFDDFVAETSDNSATLLIQ